MLGTASACWSACTMLWRSLEILAWAWHSSSTINASNGIVAQTNIGTYKVHMLFIMQNIQMIFSMLSGPRPRLSLTRCHVSKTWLLWSWPSGVIAQNLIMFEIQFRFDCGAATLRRDLHGQTLANHAKVKNKFGLGRQPRTWPSIAIKKLKISEFDLVFKHLYVKPLETRILSKPTFAPVNTILQAHWGGPEVHWWRAVTVATCGKHGMVRKVSQHVLNLGGRVPSVSSWKFGYDTMLDSGKTRLNFVWISVHLSQHPAQWFWVFCETMGKLSNVFQMFKIAPTAECQTHLNFAVIIMGNCLQYFFNVTSILDLACV